MSADMTALTNCLADMKRIYLDDPVTSVRGSNFIFPLHRYCVSQLRGTIAADVNIQVIPIEDMTCPRGKPHYPSTSIDASGYQLMQEATLFGSQKIRTPTLFFLNMQMDHRLSSAFGAKCHRWRKTSKTTMRESLENVSLCMIVSRWRQ